MSAKDVARKDAREYHEPKGEALRSPGTGNAKHRSRWTSDEENILAEDR